MKKYNKTKKISTLFTICLFVLMSTLDSSIVNIALPSISKHFDISQSQASFIVSSYLLTICISLLPFGRLGDIYGKSNIYKTGGVIFLAGSLFCGISSSLVILVLSRIIQALGSGMIMSNSNGIITEVFPPNERGRALGIVGTFVSIGGIAGPGLGGLILNYLSWHYIFLINLPVGIIAIILSYLLLPHHDSQKTPDNKLDYKGSALFSITIISLYFFITSLEKISIISLISLLLAILGLFLFIKIEKTSSYPLIKLNIFHNRLFSSSLLSALLVFTSAFFYTMIAPFYLQNIKGWTPSKAGLIMMIFPTIQIIFSPIAGILADKYNKLILTKVGLSLLCLGQVAYSLWGINTSLTVIIASIILAAFGNTLFQAPNNTITMNSVNPSDLGIAGALSALARNLGMVLGVSLSTLIMNFTVSNLAGHKVQKITENPHYFVSAMHLAFIISLIFCLLALFINGRKNKKS